MNFIRKMKIHNIVICAVILLYSALTTFGVVYAIYKGYISAGTLVNTESLTNVFDDYGKRGKTYYRSADNYYTKFLTGEVSSNRVIFGKGKWLFYKGGMSVSDFEGKDTYTKSQLEQMLEETLYVQEFLSSRGIKFALIIPPNKERIYHEYMPDNYKYCDESRTDELIDYLYKNDVNVVDVSEKLSMVKDEYQVYYKYDTHWNQLGAYIAVGGGT